jgi:23S rRNA pseudouridine1911/1915/1917 synthase
VVHPGHGNATGTVVNALLGRGVPLAPAGGTHRPGIVHRLDRGTSGLLVVAKTDRAHRALSAAFSQRAVKKRYVALVWGHPQPSEGRIERPIGRSRTNPIKMTVGGRAARAATSDYREVEHLAGFSLLDVFPTHGRTHQIRVHLQSIHHPIVGDERYGGRAWRGVQSRPKRDALASFDRLGLHAAELELAHPESGETLTFDSPLPEDFEALLVRLREP